jgi:hypothetical protein
MTKKYDRTEEMKHLMDNKDLHIPKMTSSLQELCKDTRLPLPIFWYFVLNSALRIIRQNLSEETFNETIDMCQEMQNEWVSDNNAEVNDNSEFTH